MLDCTLTDDPRSFVFGGDIRSVLFAWLVDESGTLHYTGNKLLHVHVHVGAEDFHSSYFRLALVGPRNLISIIVTGWAHVDVRPYINI